MPHGVRVNAVAPLALTRMLDALPAFQTDALQSAQSIAPLFAYLASAASSGITGQVIRFNGRDLSLLQPPSTTPEVLSENHWDSRTIAQALEQLSLKPIGLGASEYQPPNKKG